MINKEKERTVSLGRDVRVLGVEKIWSEGNKERKEKFQEEGSFTLSIGCSFSASLTLPVTGIPCLSTDEGMSME